MSFLGIMAAIMVGLTGAWAVLRNRGGRWGEWSWRDGGHDPDV